MTPTIVVKTNKDASLGDPCCGGRERSGSLISGRSSGDQRVRVF